MTDQTTTCQRTLAREVQCTGIGLHGGRPVSVRLIPAPSGSGISFRRRDVAIPAHVNGVSEVDHATTLSSGTNGGAASVQTVEHLLAALHGLGIDNCHIDVDGDELPIMDGSAAPWVYLLHEAGVHRQAAGRNVRRILRPFSVSVGDASISVYPSDTLRVTCRIDFAHPAIGKQEHSLAITPRTFAEEIAPARTFGFLREVEALRRAGLVKGGSYSNAIVLDEHGVLNGKLRFTNEFVRHKMLDLIGDLALTGMPLIGHVVAHRAGHRVHAEFVRRLLQERSCWRVENSADGRVAAARQLSGSAAGSLFGVPHAQPLAYPE